MKFNKLLFFSVFFTSELCSQEAHIVTLNDSDFYSFEKHWLVGNHFTFRDSLKDGEWVLVGAADSDGFYDTLASGCFKNGRRSGLFTFSNEYGTVVKEFYKNGRKDGPFIIDYGEGSFTTGFFVMGLRNGPSKSYYKNRIEELLLFKNDKLISSTDFRSALYKVTEYDIDSDTSKIYKYYESGILSLIATYKSDTLISYVKYYKNGVRKEEGFGEFVDPVYLKGLDINYYYSYDKDEIVDGCYLEYDKSGNVKLEICN